MQLSDDKMGRSAGSGSNPLHIRPGTGQRLRILVGGLVIVLLTGFIIIRLVHWRHESTLASEAIGRSEAATPVEVVTARFVATGRPLVLPGETAAWQESVIYARVSGYVANWSADIGDHVQRGQVLAMIETPELDADLVAARAKLRAADATVNLREAEANFAETTYARWRDSPKGVVSDQEREDKKAQSASAQAKLAEARAVVNVDQAEVDRYASFEHFKQVTAPYEGTITERRIDIGNLVAAGSSNQTMPLFRMAKSDPVRIFVEVPQSAASDLMKDGVAAEITANDLAGRHFQAKVTRTSQSIDPRARTFRAEIDLPNKDLALLPGMYVQVAFELSNHGTVQVPASAMLFRNDGPHVAVLDSAQKVHFSKVAIARDDGMMIELASGVAANDRVVLNINSRVGEGDVVHMTALDGKSVDSGGSK